MMLEHIERKDTGVQLMLPIPLYSAPPVDGSSIPLPRPRRWRYPRGEQLELLLEWVNEARSERDEPKRESPPTWTEEEILILREGLLQDSLRTCLDARNSQDTRDALWAWIDSDEEHPFSFRVCAQAVGTDHEELRNSFKLMARRFENERAGQAA